MDSCDLAIRIGGHWTSYDLSLHCFRLALLKCRLVLRCEALLPTRAYDTRLALCNDILVIMLHGIQLAILNWLINTACIVIGCGFRPYEDFRLTAFTALLTVIIIRIRSFKLVLGALIQG